MFNASEVEKIDKRKSILFKLYFLIGTLLRTKAFLRDKRVYKRLVKRLGKLLFSDRNLKPCVSSVWYRWIPYVLSYILVYFAIEVGIFL